MKLSTLSVFCLVLFVFACSTSPTAPPTSQPTTVPSIAPTVDVDATATRISANIFATLTASAPKATDTPNPTNTPKSTDTPAPTDTPLPSATPKATATPISFQGKGKTATKAFALETGLVVFYTKHDGSRNIIVSLLDSNGDLVDGIVNEIGLFDGRKAVAIRNPGNYLLNIEADGNWNIDIQPLSPTGIEPIAPVVFKGCGSNVALATFNKGLARIELAHNGKRNFIVSMYTLDGDLVDSLVNEIGAFEGSTAVGIDNTSVYALDILADGEWTISIAQGDKSVEGVTPIVVAECAKSAAPKQPTTQVAQAETTPKPTLAPKPKPTVIPALPPVHQDELVHLTPEWDVTLISVRRDKGVFFYDQGEIAFGVYASFLFRARNLQSGSDHIGRTLGFSVRADDGPPIYYELFNTYDYKARWFYSCCEDAFHKLGPGEENVFLVTFDVPENAKTLAFQFTEPNPFERNVRAIGPAFVVPNFDQIAPRK